MAINNDENGCPEHGKLAAVKCNSEVVALY